MFVLPAFDKDDPQVFLKHPGSFAEDLRPVLSGHCCFRRLEALAPLSLEALAGFFCGMDHEGAAEQFSFHPLKCASQYMGVSNNSGTPKSSILIGFSIINHPFRGTAIFGNTHIWGVVFSCTYDGSQSCNKFCLRNFGAHSL